MNEPTADQTVPTIQSRRAVKGMAFLTAFAFIGCSVWFVGAVKDAREAARQSQCLGHFKQLVVALHEYHDTFGCFPPAYTTDADGNPMHSWRVLILPWLEEKEFLARYDFRRPWNDPENLKLGREINLDLFHCPSESNHGQSEMTNYVVVVGDQTAFPRTRSVALKEITDGSENTILLVEIANSDIHWMEPRDLDLAKMPLVVNDPRRASISSHHPRGPGVSFADGRGMRFAESIRPATLQSLLTISGHESVRRERLLLPSDGSGLRIGEASTLIDK